MIDDMDDPDDVDCGLEPTAGMMRKFYDRDFGDAHRNVTQLLREQPMTAHALRGASLHNEHTVGQVVAMLADAGQIARLPDGRWSWEPYEFRMGVFAYLRAS
jgi:hypothetical protein